MDAAPDFERVRREALVVRSAAEVSAALDAMAAQISARLARADPLVVAIMHGGVYTAVHLCERFGFLHEFDYLHVSRYGASLEGGVLQWIVAPKPSFRDRAVLLVDDVLDRGGTLTCVQAALEHVGVAEIQTAVLVRKPAGAATARPRVDYVGIEAGPEYLFGCGMDYMGRWRNLPSLYAVRDSGST